MKRLRCWPGCTAVFTRCDFPENVGKTVTVLYRSDGNRGTAWNIRSSFPIVAEDEDGDDIVIPPGVECSARDSDLTPLTQPPGTEIGDETLDVPAPQKSEEPA